MHELSIAQSLVELVVEQLPAGEALRVSAVRIRVGVLSGVLAQALRSAWVAAVGGSPLSGSRLEIEGVPLLVWCPGCGCERTPAGPQRLRCPVCQARTPQVL